MYSNCIRGKLIDSFTRNCSVKFPSRKMSEQTDPAKIVAATSSSPQRSLQKSPTKLAKYDFKTKLKVDPKDTTVIVFPGQGNQFVGMGAEVSKVSNAKKLYDVAESILGYDLLDLCINGPMEKLTKTINCQPAIYVTSLAAVEYLRSINATEVETCVSTAGFSMGEFTSLVFAGAISFEDGLRLLQLRAEAMQAASELAPSSMVTVFYNADAQVNLACQAATEWCKRLQVPDQFAICSIANYLFPHSKVIGGHEEAIKFLELNGKEFGLKKMRRLQVSGAFHTALMNPAQDVLTEALKQMKIELPLIPVYSNYDGKIYRSVEEIREKLALQTTHAVKWEQILHRIYDRKEGVPFPRTYECGPGTSLLSTLGMVNREARQFSKNIKV